MTAANSEELVAYWTSERGTRVIIDVLETFYGVVPNTGKS
jgi:hypothetical protein